MRERPIIFTGESVRAILAGRKTQTRRVVRLIGAEVVEERDDSGRLWPWSPQHDGWVACPYGAPGDRLWVRETFRLRADQDHKPPSQDWWKSGAWYEADTPGGIVPSGCGGGAGRLRSPIHMPRWASRLTLEIESVRVERVQAITEADARAEGMQSDADMISSAEGLAHLRGSDAARALPSRLRSARENYRDAWDAINGRRPGCSWADNPWVWCLTFRTVGEV